MARDCEFVDNSELVSLANLRKIGAKFTNNMRCATYFNEDETLGKIFYSDGNGAYFPVYRIERDDKVLRAYLE